MHVLGVCGFLDIKVLIINVFKFVKFLLQLLLQPVSFLLMPDYRGLFRPLCRDRGMVNITNKLGLSVYVPIGTFA